MQRVRPEVRRFYIRERNDKQLWRKLAHDLATHKESEFVARGRSAPSNKTRDRGLNTAPHSRVEPVGCVKHIPSQSFVVAPLKRALQFRLYLASICHIGCSTSAQSVYHGSQQELLGKHHVSSKSRTKI